MLGRPVALLALCWLWSTVLCHTLPARSTSEPYAPQLVTCPSEPLSRPARGAISQAEQAYISMRSPQANSALLSWLKSALGSGFGTDNSNGWNDWGNKQPPRLALALSGGGPKAGLTAAGVVQGLDSRDSSTGVSGLLQSMTYVSALSGGTFTLTGVMANNFSTISALRKSLWEQSYQNQLVAGVNNSLKISNNVNAKVAAGYPASLVDLFASLDAYNFVNSQNGAAGVTWSSILEQSAFRSAQAPFPILTMTNTDILAGQCFPSVTGPIWEISPAEFGSWDPSVDAFAQTKYLGTSVTNGKATSSDNCTIGFDQTSSLIGMSADILPTGVNCSMPTNKNVVLSGLPGTLKSVFPHANVDPSEYGIVPSPFYGSSDAGNISVHKDLYMLDGGDTRQVIPIMPWLQAPREIDVIFVVDENSSPPYNITNGSSIYSTYLDARRLGIDNMPAVPSVATQLATNFSASAHFLGCHKSSQTTIIYLPNSLETQYSSDTFAFTPEAIADVIAKGTDIVTQSDSTEWPKCLACAIIHKDITSLSEDCTSCLQKYCYVP